MQVFNGLDGIHCTIAAVSEVKETIIYAVVPVVHGLLLIVLKCSLVGMLL